MHPDCVAAYEEASELLASLGHEVVDIVMPFGPDAVPVVRDALVCHGHAGPGGPGQEERLLPLTRYLRERGSGVRAGELVMAQAYLQAIVRGALEVLNNYDAVLTPTLASPPVPVGLFRGGHRRRRTSSGRSGSPRIPPCSTCPASPR